mgnify:CR=1 FL=1
MNAGKSSTSIFQIASIPNSGYSTHSMLLIELLERTAAYTTDSTEVETTMLLASLCNNIATVTLGNHYKASAMILELIYVWVHTVGCGRSHRATWITLWSLGWSCIEDRVVLEVLWHLLACIQTSLSLA